MHFRPVISRNVKRRILCSFNTTEILVICYSLISVWFAKTFWPYSRRFPAQGEVLWDPHKHHGDDSQRSSTLSVGTEEGKNQNPHEVSLILQHGLYVVSYLFSLIFFCCELRAHCLIVTSYFECPDLPSLIQRGHHHWMPPTMNHNQFLSLSVCSL